MPGIEVERDTFDALIDTLTWMISDMKWRCDQISLANKGFTQEVNPFTPDIQSGPYTNELKLADVLLAQLVKIREASPK